MAAASPCSALARTVLPEEAFSPGEEAVVVEVVGRARPEWQHQSKSVAGCLEETAQLALEDVRTTSDEVCCGEEEFWWCGAHWGVGVRRRWWGLASPQMWCGASLWLKGFGIWWLGRGGHQIDGLAGHWRGGPGRRHSDGGRHSLGVLSTQRKGRLWCVERRRGWDSDGPVLSTPSCCRN